MKNYIELNGMVVPRRFAESCSWRRMTQDAVDPVTWCIRYEGVATLDYTYLIYDSESDRDRDWARLLEFLGEEV